MAVKQVVVSDISGDELADGDHVRVIVQHPDIAGPVEIDVSSAEAAKLTETTLRLVALTVLEPDRPPRTVQVETSALQGMFGDVDLDRVLEGARRAELASLAPSQRPGRSVAAPAAPRERGENVDYTAPDRFGQLHRGRVTEEEARLVREHREQASANRQAQGRGSIDFSDPAEVRRYGL
jgi:hypothetical protein